MRIYSDDSIANDLKQFVFNKSVFGLIAPPSDLIKIITGTFYNYSNIFSLLVNRVGRILKEHEASLKEVYVKKDESWIVINYKNSSELMEDVFYHNAPMKFKVRVFNSYYEFEVENDE